MLEFQPGFLANRSNFELDKIVMFHNFKFNLMRKKVFLLLAVLSGSLCAGANTLVVTSTETVTEEPSATVGSLSYCLNEAEDGDIITFDASLSGATIKFDAQLTLSMNIDLDASGLASPIIFDGQSRTPFFVLSTYEDRFTNEQTNRFTNIVFQNGYTETAGEPGAINVFAKRSYFTNCQFINNRSMDAGTNRQPGALRNSNSHSFMYLTGCVFRGNETARKGGAISVDAPTLYIDRCLFDSNKAGDSGAAIDTKDGSIGGDNVSPIIDIRNTTFVNNTCNYRKKNDGIVIFNGQSSSPYPLRLINCTFVGNENLTQSDVSTVYVTNSNIQIAGCLFGGNKFLKNDVMNYANDVRIGNDPGIIESYGYNYVYSMNAATSQTESPMIATDVEYKTWTAVPLLKEEVNEQGVCVPSDTLLNSDLWKDLKAIPEDLMYELLGENAVDQTGSKRESKLSFIGAYEYPAYVLDIEDEYYGAIPAVGMHKYKSGENVEISTNNENVVSWLVNGKHNFSMPLELVMDQDYDVVANYDEVVTNVENVSEAQRMSYVDGTLYINGGRGANLQVYSATGQLLLNRVIDSDTQSIVFDKPANTMCLMLLRYNNGERYVQKII